MRRIAISSDRNSFTRQQWRCQHGALSEALLENFADWELGVRLGGEVVDVDSLPFNNSSTGY